MSFIQRFIASALGRRKRPKAVVKEFQVSRVVATVWRSATAEGNPCYKVSFNRLGNSKELGRGFYRSDLTSVQLATFRLREWLIYHDAFQRSDCNEHLLDPCKRRALAGLVHECQFGNVLTSLWQKESQGIKCFSVTFHRVCSRGESLWLARSFDAGDLAAIRVGTGRALAWLRNQPTAQSAIRAQTDGKVSVLKTRS